MIGEISHHSSPISLSFFPTCQEPELQHLLGESRLIESQYSHYFDWIIVNDDLSVRPHTHTHTHERVCIPVSLICTSMMLSTLPIPILSTTVHIKYEAVKICKAGCLE